jgi:hypothetical protein
MQRGLLFRELVEAKSPLPRSLDDLAFTVSGHSQTSIAVSLVNSHPTRTECAAEKNHVVKKRERASGLKKFEFVLKKLTFRFIEFQNEQAEWPTGTANSYSLTQ